MPHSAHYRIDYLYNGAYKSFYVSSENMTNAAAWHWAAVDSGVAEIPKYRSDKVKVFSKPLAERRGITEVQWSQG
jgi:hypothetical protein